jgi:hypothetical protein
MRFERHHGDIPSYFQYVSTTTIDNKIEETWDKVKDWDTVTIRRYEYWQGENLVAVLNHSVWEYESPDYCSIEGQMIIDWKPNRY